MIITIFRALLVSADEKLENAFSARSYTVISSF